MQIIFKNIGELFIKTKFNLAFTIILFILINVSGCSKQQVLVPKLTPEPTNLRFVGKFVWFDLFTQDLQSASRFYEGLFGWSFYDTSYNSVKTILREGIPIANAIHINQQKRKVNVSRWLSYMSVEDVDQTVKLVEQYNGSIYMRPKNLPYRGRVAVVIDTEGALFAIVTASGGDSPDEGFIENSWMGSELWTTDIDSALRFYGLLVGYEQQLVDIGKDLKYHFLVKDDQPRAGIVRIPWDNVKPEWIPYIAVKDVISTANKAKQLGGKLLVEPDKDVREGFVAIIADPSGAVFAIYQLRNESSGGETPK